MDGVTIRRARADDKEAVLSIHGNVYDGRDYLPAYYDHFMACQEITPYVAVVDGEIVAFAASFVIDGGTTVVTRAGRSSPRVTGKGVYMKLKKHILKSSQARLNVFTCADANPNVSKNTFLKDHTTVLCKPMTRYLTDFHDIYLPPENSLLTTSLNLREMSAADLDTYMTSQLHADYLFPKGRFIADWVPFKLLASNIPLVAPPKDTALFLTNVDTKGRSTTGLLSICTTFTTRDPPFSSNLEIYGTETASLKGHVIAHIKHIRDKTDDVTSLLVFVEPEMENATDEVFAEIGLVKKEWREYNPETLYSKQYLFEKAI